MKNRAPALRRGRNRDKSQIIANHRARRVITYAMTFRARMIISRCMKGGFHRPARAGRKHGEPLTPSLPLRTVPRVVMPRSCWRCVGVTSVVAALMMKNEGCAATHTNVAGYLAQIWNVIAAGGLSRPCRILRVVCGLSSGTAARLCVT